mmetsp:Transcript_16029/g.33905  ORF Transcript_16029/g.33905 Transcript_16029/m.33905 type:complete len:82 (-) Transcript_16029:30-275(-)
MPALTKVMFEVERIRELANQYRDNGRIARIKDSSFDLNCISKLCQIKNEVSSSWSLLIGAEWHVARRARYSLGRRRGVVGG